LPLCETFPYTFDTNRSKSYYSNVTLSDGININFEDIIKNIGSFLNKIGNKPENQTVIIFDNLSTISLEKNKLIEQFNLIYNYCFENVKKINYFISAKNLLGFIFRILTLIKVKNLISILEYQFDSKCK